MNTPARLISVEQAIDLVVSEAVAFPPRRVPIDDALGLVLAESIVSDLDSPPFDKSLVDGYAVALADVIVRPATLRVVEEVSAGMVPRSSAGGGAAIRIMTGSPLPTGADAVVMVEETVTPPEDGSSVRIQSPKVTLRQNIMERGRSYACGAKLLGPGKVLRPADIGLLAETGRTLVTVHPRPRVAVLSTGNELVPVSSVPAAGQIRNSNGPMLAAQIRAAGAIDLPLGIARDDLDSLEAAIQQGLVADMLLLSGGVSAGVLDLVPQVLEKLGVRCIFHKVNLKPGKPLWFGVHVGEGRTKLVFGLPGNPVSSLVCFELFVRPAIARILGRNEERSELLATLAAAFHHRGDRPTYFPAVLDPHTAQVTVRLLDWQGSADLRTLAEANCLVRFPSGEAAYPAGSVVSALPLDMPSS